MSRLTGTDAKGLLEAYQAVYAPQKLTEEDQINFFIIEWYNALIEDGFINDEKIEELYESEILEGIDVFGKIAGAVTNYGPKIVPTLQKLTGFGLGTGVGGKRRALTTGAATVAAIDPEKAAQRVSGAATGIASGINRGVRAAAGQAVPAAQTAAAQNAAAQNAAERERIAAKFPK